MSNRINIPDELEWREIWYHPSPIITRYQGGDYWERTIPGCKIDVVPEDLGFMKYLVRGIKIKVTFPDDWQDMYVEPLATIHTKFFDALNSVIYKIYPFYHRNKNGAINGKSRKLWQVGGQLHSIVANLYWDLDYKNYTPLEWVNVLNKVLEYIENHKISDERKLDDAKEELRLIFSKGCVDDT